MSEHVQDPAEDQRTLCGMLITPRMVVADIRDGVSQCRECTTEADAWWAAEDATWD